MICRSWHGKNNVFRFLCFNSFYLVFFLLRLAWEKVLFNLGNTGPWFGIFKINCQFMTCTTTKIGWWILTVGRKRKTNFIGDHVNEIFKACLVVTFTGLDTHASCGILDRIARWHWLGCQRSNCIFSGSVWASSDFIWLVFLFFRSWVNWRQMEFRSTISL